jgi:hypothetical protein
VNSRWYIDEICLVNAETEPAITATGSIDNSRVTPILVDALKASHGEPMWKQTSEQRRVAKQYAEIFGKCREATKLSCELKDDRLLHYLDGLLLDLLQKKEQLNCNTSIEDYGENSDLTLKTLSGTEKENVHPSIDKLCNPPSIATKGRPCKKRLPNEGLYEAVNKKRHLSVSNVGNKLMKQDVKKQRNTRHCSNCGSDKHNAQTCKQK